MRQVLLAALAALPLLAAAPLPDPPLLGQRPSYGPRLLTIPPGSGAVEARLWAPGLDEGYTPQGLAIAGGTLIVSAYRSTSPWQRKGPCRVFQVDPRTGEATGRLDLPPPCGHAGGAAVVGGILFVSDTRTLFATPLDRAFGPQPGPIGAFPLGEGLTGGLAAAVPDALWIGTYRTDGPGRLFRFDAAVLAGLASGAALSRGMASAELPLPSYAQGAAFDPDRQRLWVSRSDLHWGTLDELDLRDGRLLRRHPAPAGLEGIAFDGGRLWAVSEAGARQTFDLPLARLVWPFHPVIFGLNPALLGQ